MKSQRGQPGIFSLRKPENATAELGISNLSLRFGGVRALNNIDLEVHTGEFVAVIGPNGAGKPVELRNRFLPAPERPHAF
jgi:ABC-type branched-chain amino acid transport systems, ATPase component